MKKSANTSIYNPYSQENTFFFLTVSSVSFQLKRNLMDLCAPIAFLFQEKLPIIYANIRVWIADYFVLFN